MDRNERRLMEIIGPAASLETKSRQNVTPNVTPRKTAVAEDMVGASQSVGK